MAVAALVSVQSEDSSSLQGHSRCRPVIGSEQSSLVHPSPHGAFKFIKNVD